MGGRRMPVSAPCSGSAGAAPNPDAGADFAIGLLRSTASCRRIWSPPEYPLPAGPVDRRRHHRLEELLIKLSHLFTDFAEIGEADLSPC